MRVVWLDDTHARVVTFVFKTRDIETWGDWEGHQVLIGDQPVGRLKDPDDQDGRHEPFKLDVERSLFERLIGPTQSFSLTVALETQPDHPALSDDFLLEGIEVQHATVRLGS
jgi:hypothetical protein